MNLFGLFKKKEKAPNKSCQEVVDGFESALDNFISVAEEADSDECLQKIRIQYLGQEGVFAELMKNLRHLDKKDRIIAGRELNKCINKAQTVVSLRQKDVSGLVGV